MEPEELSAVYERLRSFAVEHGLAWILEEIDDAVALGVVEVKQLRQSSRSGRQVYEELTQTELSAQGRKRAEEFLSRRPMTELEQVEALLAALRRVLVELDSVAAASVAQVNGLPLADSRGSSPPERSIDATNGAEGDDLDVTVVFEIDFEPDQGSTAPAVTTEAVRHDVMRSVEAKRLLDELVTEVHR